jgi:hypothetical protein
VVLSRARARALVGAGACAWACALAGAAGCGSGLAPGDGYDQPLFTFYGAPASNTSFPDPAKAKLGVLWGDPFQAGSDIPMPPAWYTPILATDSNGNYRIDLFRPPPPAAITRVGVARPGHDFADIAVADLVIFEDRTNDGAFRTTGIHAEMASDDGYLAASEALLLYVARPFSGPVPADFPLGDVSRAGYKLIDLACNGPISRGPKEIIGTYFVAQPSQRLPELRGCGRTHSP